MFIYDNIKEIHYMGMDDDDVFLFVNKINLFCSNNNNKQLVL